jgi:hypothetical protein
METAGPIARGHTFPVSAIALKYANPSRGEALQSMNTVDKIAGLKQILALDPKNSFPRYGIAVELANRGEIDAQLPSSTNCWTSIPTTPGYFMAAQTLAKHGRTAETIARLGSGISCAARTDNRHALSEMRACSTSLTGKQPVFMRICPALSSQVPASSIFLLSFASRIYNICMPKFSIVVPFHNEEENATALSARLKQSWSRSASELVLVDDGSSDRTYSCWKKSPRSTAAFFSSTAPQLRPDLGTGRHLTTHQCEYILSGRRPAARQP